MSLLALCLLAIALTPAYPPSELPDLSDTDNGNIGTENGVAATTDLGIEDSSDVREKDLQQLVNRSIARVELIRNTEFEGSVSVRILTSEEYKTQLGTGGTTSSDFRRFDNTKLEALMLIGENEDSLSTQRQQRGEVTTAYYQFNTDTLTIVRPENGSISEVTVAHEVAHAFQDEAVGLSSFTGPTREKYNAKRAVVEGEAEFIDSEYEKLCSLRWECIQPPSESASGDINVGLNFMNYFVYSDGYSFVKAQHESGGWGSVDEIRHNPPTNTRQVISPDKYPSFTVDNVMLRDTSSTEWERITFPNRSDRASYGEVGQPSLAAMFAHTHFDGYNESGVGTRAALFEQPADETDVYRYDFEPVEGWAGDKMYVYYNDEQNETAYVWRVSWETDGDAQAFASGYEQLLSHWGGKEVTQNTWRLKEDSPFADAFHISVTGDTVTITNAPTMSDLDDVN